MDYYQNTGYARNKTLTITRGALYMQPYDIAAGFTWGQTTYPSLSDEGFARLSDDEYERRLADFVQYVYSLEDGLQTDCPDLTIGSVVYDPEHCQIPIVPDVANGWEE